MKLICLTSHDSIRKHRDLWNDLAAEHPFCNWEWMSSWYESFASADQIQIAVVADKNNWYAMLPMVINQPAAGTRSLEFASHGQACADYVGPVIRPGYFDQTAPLLSSWIRGKLYCRKAPIDFVQFDGVSINNEPFLNFVEAFADDGFGVTRIPGEGCWVAELAEDWNTFESQIKKSFRRKTRKAVKNTALPDVSVSIIRNETELQDAWPQFVRLHQLRRHSLHEAGCFSDHTFETFLKTAIGRLSGSNRASLILAQFQQLPFAALLMLHNETQSFMYQSGSDPEYMHLEPGHLLGTVAIQDAIAKHHRSFDFLRGDEPYKANWNAQRVELLKLRIVANRISSKMKNHFWQTGRTIKNWLPAGLAGPRN